MIKKTLFAHPMKTEAIQAIMVIDSDETKANEKAKNDRIIIIERNGGGDCQKATLPDGTVIYVCGPKDPPKKKPKP